MFEQSRLSYIVPGYTGHIPGQQFKETKDNEVLQISQQHQHEPIYQIPGYIGYVPSIKSENMFGKSYGKLTYSISSGEYVKGKDLDKANTYKSIAQETFVNQRTVNQRSAAEIVGVKPKQEIFHEQLPLEQINNFYGLETPQDQLNATIKFHNQVKTFRDSKSQFNQTGCQTKLNEPVKFGQPLPGYTGTTRRIMSNNIFGQTFAASLKSAENDIQKLDQDKSMNVNAQLNTIPKFPR